MRQERIAKLRMTQLKINDKNDTFEGCELESQLCRQFVSPSMICLPMTDYELQGHCQRLNYSCRETVPYNSKLSLW